MSLLESTVSPVSFPQVAMVAGTLRAAKWTQSPMKTRRCAYATTSRTLGS